MMRSLRFGLSILFALSISACSSEQDACTTPVPVDSALLRKLADSLDDNREARLSWSRQENATKFVGFKSISISDPKSPRWSPLAGQKDGYLIEIKWIARHPEGRDVQQMYMAAVDRCGRIRDKISSMDPV